MIKMKTEKAKTASKPKKKSETVKPVRAKKVAASENFPSEDQIREKAREIYYERISRGEHGTPESDWHEAEQLLKG
jgi:hypothetical protein